MVRRPLVVVVVFALAALVLAACGSSGSSTANVKSTTTTTTSPTQTTKAADRQPNSQLSVPEITTMQADLKTVGCYSAAVGGVIGPITRAAIAAFQTGAGITADGQYGPVTKAKLTADARAKTIVCTSTSGTTTTVAATAPCTNAAIQPAVDSTGNGKVSLIDFGCDGAWAWAGIGVGSGSGGYEATNLLKANGGTWAVVDRAKYCVQGQLPADVYTPGCTTN